MTFALGILLKRVRHRNGPIAQILAIHRIHRSIRCLETCKIDKRKSFRVTRLRVSHNLRGLQNHPKRRKRIIQQLLVHLGIQVPDEDVRSHVQILLMRRGLVHTDRLTVQLDHVHNLDRIVGILLAQELHEPVALVHLRYAILGHMDIYNRASLDEHLPQQRLRDLIVQPTDVDSGICKQRTEQG